MVHITVWERNGSGVDSRMTVTFAEFLRFLESHTPKSIVEITVDGYADPTVRIVREDYMFTVHLTFKQFDKLKSKFEELNRKELRRL